MKQRTSIDTDKPKLRWWQFGLRNVFVLVTLFSVLAVGLYRLRLWGRELVQTRFEMAVGSRWQQEQSRSDWLKKINKFDSKYWIPLKTYELTSDYELDSIYILGPRNNK